MKIHSVKSLVIQHDDAGELRLEYDNRGEPFREGVTLSLTCSDNCVHVFLDSYETQRLYTKLGEFLGKPLKEENTNAPKV